MNKLKKKFKFLRRNRATAIFVNGGRQTVYRCICGAEHSCATKYRHAKHVQKWREEHDSCVKFFEKNIKGVKCLNDEYGHFQFLYF